MTEPIPTPIPVPRACRTRPRHAQIAPAQTILVHGEQEVMQRFAGGLQGTTVQVPALSEVIELPAK